MSTRPQIKPHPVVTNGAMATDITSEVTIISNLSMLGYSLSWAGASLSGAVSVEVSNDYSTNPDGSVNNSGTWTTITFLDQDGSLVNSFPISTDSGNGFLNISQMPAYACRLKYTASAGTGALQAVVVGKVQ